MCGRVGFCFCHVLRSSCWCWYLILASATFPWSDHLLRDTICCKICSKGEKLFLNKQESYWTFLRYRTSRFFLLSASSLFVPPSHSDSLALGLVYVNPVPLTGKVIGKYQWSCPGDSCFGRLTPPPPLPPQKFSAIEYPLVVAVVTSSFTLAVPRSTFASRELPCRFSLWCCLLICHLHAIQPLGYALTTPAVSWIRLRTGW